MILRYVNPIARKKGQYRNGAVWFQSDTITPVGASVVRVGFFRYYVYAAFKTRLPYEVAFGIGRNPVVMYGSAA